MELKDKIKILREVKQLTQAQLGLGSGVNHSTVSYWESGRQEPNSLQRKQLCKFLGITQSELFKDVG